MNGEAVRVLVEKLLDRGSDEGAFEQYVFDEDVSKFKLSAASLAELDDDDLYEGFDPYEGDPCYFAEVPASTLARWKAARDAYAAAQLEMAACYAARHRLYEAAEQARREADAARVAAEAQAYAAEEARLDEKLGPRVWRAISRQRSSGYRGGRKQTVAVLHHLDCPSSNGGQTTSAHMRLAEAVAWLLDEPRPGHPPRDRCGRCCKPIAEAHDEQMRKRYSQPYQLDES